MTNSEVDKFVKTAREWKDEIEALREVILSTALEETFKWSKPCYTFEGANIVIIQPFKESLGLMLFKGMLLKDTKKILVENGPNSQSAKRFEFTSVEQIEKLKPTIKSYLREAIELEKSGQKVEKRIEKEPVIEELVAAFKKSAKFQKAFEALTPGRQRAYILHFKEAKQKATRVARIEKHRLRIMDGLGLNDRG